MKKAQIWISVIIYTLVAVVALVLILNTGIPVLTEMKDRAVFSKIKEVMLDIDSQIANVASQDEGSQSSVSFEVRNGEMKFYDNQLVWELETDSEIISPRTSSTLGNLIIASNANVQTFEYDTYYLMNTSLKGDIFSVKINKLGSADSPGNWNTTDILEYTSYNGNKMDGIFTFTLNNNQTTNTGVMYTEMIPSGNNSNLGRAKVVAHVDNSFGEYDIEFVLESYADFLTVQVKNFRPRT